MSMNYSNMCLDYMANSLDEVFKPNDCIIIDITSNTSDLNMNFIVPSLKLKGNIASVFLNNSEGFLVSLANLADLSGKTNWYALTDDAEKSAQKAFSKYHNEKGVLNYG